MVLSLPIGIGVLILLIVVVLILWLFITGLRLSEERENTRFLCVLLEQQEKKIAELNITTRNADRGHR